MVLREALAAARRGEIRHLRAPHPLSPLHDLLGDAFRDALGVRDLTAALPDLSWEKLDAALRDVSGALDASGAHLRRLGEVLVAEGIRDEQLLRITLYKSLRASLAGRGRLNYGYQAHRDSWFDLAPDGINVVLYLTDVPYHGNTRFFTDFYGKEVAYEPGTRRLLDESALVRSMVFDCRAGDCLVFAGDQLHAGALADVSRLSIEFRLSKQGGHGRPDQDIVYQPLPGCT